MRNTIARKMSTYADNGQKFIVLSADLGYSVFDTFKEQHPSQFFNSGIAENTMVGVAAGLAMTGKKVFVYSIASFIAEKCFEQIREDICYPQLPVILMGTGAGFAYGEAGVTHWANEDIGCLRTIPELTILSPSDPVELELLLDQSLTYPHPIYFRLGKNGEKSFCTRKKLQIGQAYYLEKERDIALVAHGNIMEEEVRAWELLKNEGLNVSIVSSPTIKPFDRSFFVELAKTHKYIYVVEEHSEIGGLGDALSFLGVRKIAIKDEVLNIGGNVAYLRQRVGIDTESIYTRIRQALK
jgi:transketolase